MWCGLIVFRDRHGRKAISPDSRGAEQQLFREEAVQLSEPRRKLQMQISLHEFRRPSIYRLLQFFLRPGPFVSDLFFPGVPVPEGKKMTRHE